MDSGSFTLLALGEAGIRTSGGRGSRFNAYNDPTDLDATHELTVYVADPGTRRIVLLDRHLQFVSEIHSRNDRFDRIALNRYRELFALDTQQRAIRKFRPNGEIDAAFSPPSFRNESVADVAVSGDHVLIAQGKTLFILNRFGLEIGFRTFPETIRRVAGSADGLAVSAGKSVFIMDGAFKTVSVHEFDEPVVDIALRQGRLWLLFPHRLAEKTLH